MPKVERNIWLPSAGEQQLAQALITNQVDYSMSIQPATMPTVFRQNPKITTHSGQKPPYGYMDWWPYSLYVNNEKPPFNDKDIRWALSSFIDRQQIVDVSWAGAAEPSPLPLPAYPALLPYINAVKDILAKYNTLEFNPKKGEAMFSAKGWKKDSAGVSATWLPQLALGRGHLPASYPEFGPLAEHLRFVERASRRLARSVFYGMARWQGKLERKQGYLGRLVDISAELFAMSCACVRAQMLAEEDRAHGAEAQGLADIFCRGSRRRVERLFTELLHNDDAHNYRAAQDVLAGKYIWAESGIIDPSGEGPMIAAPQGAGFLNVHRGGLVRAREPEPVSAAR